MTGKRSAALATTAVCRSTRSTSGPGDVIPTASRTPTARWRRRWPSTRPGSGSPTWSSCPSRPTRSVARGGTRSPGTTRPTPGRGTPTTCGRSIDTLHDAGLGVIVDWVPGHFPRDDGALARFDGTALYEHADPRRGEHPDWGTYEFNFGRHEVANFLMANALYWLEEFRVDGLRVDAVASMLYLDYSREPGEWVPNVHGGREDLDAIAFLRDAQRRRGRGAPGRPGDRRGVDGVARRHRPHRDRRTGVLAEVEPRVDARHALATSPTIPCTAGTTTVELTFPMMYAFDERWVLPLSHDEVVHGKGALLDKMPGDQWQRLANLRALLAWQWSMPGRRAALHGCRAGPAPRVVPRPRARLVAGVGSRSRADRRPRGRPQPAGRRASGPVARRRGSSTTPGGRTPTGPTSRRWRSDATIPSTAAPCWWRPTSRPCPDPATGSGLPPADDWRIVLGHRRPALRRQRRRPVVDAGGRRHPVAGPGPLRGAHVAAARRPVDRINLACVTPTGAPLACPGHATVRARRHRRAHLLPTSRSPRRRGLSAVWSADLPVVHGQCVGRVPVPRVRAPGRQAAAPRRRPSQGHRPVRDLHADRDQRRGVHRGCDPRSPGERRPQRGERQLHRPVRHVQPVRRPGPVVPADHRRVPPRRVPAHRLQHVGAVRDRAAARGGPRAVALLACCTPCPCSAARSVS